MEEPSQETEIYQAPTIQRLGTLAELTLGGEIGGIDDGFGDSGEIGSV